MEFKTVLDLYNTETKSITDLLSFKTAATAEAIPTRLCSDSFDGASDLGVPTAAGVPGEALLVGYRFRDYDKATRFSWRFVRDADLGLKRAMIRTCGWFSAG